MDLAGKTIALYGRFSPGARERLSAAVASAGGHVARDFTAAADILIVGSRSTALAAAPALVERLAGAHRLGARVMGERAFADRLAGAPPLGPDPAFPLAAALAQTGWTLPQAHLFAAFDLIATADDRCRFGDVSVLRAAAELRAAGQGLPAIVAILMEVRDRAPLGRRKVVVTPEGAAALQWDDGLTSLSGQGLLPLEAEAPDPFEEALVAEAEADWTRAADLFDLAARIDRRCPIAPFNAGNALLRLERPREAALAYRRAIARNKRFIEAHYNLAVALEALGMADKAREALRAALALDPAHADAVFNLAHLELAAGEVAQAQALFQRYLALDPPADWGAKALRALAVCQAAAR